MADSEDFENVRTLVIEKVTKQICECAEEVQDLYLRDKWTQDRSGKPRQTAEQRAKEVCELIRDKPELYEDIMMSLRQRQTSLGIEIEQKLKQLNSLKIK